MLFGGLLEGLGYNDNPDVEKNADPRLERNKVEHGLDRAGKAKEGDEDPVQGRVAGTRPEPLPSRVADVNSRGKGAAEERSDHRADAIGHKRRKGPVTIPCGLCALNILERTDNVESAEAAGDRYRTFPSLMANGI